jgi:hypothetical protein
MFRDVDLGEFGRLVVEDMLSSEITQVNQLQMYCCN